MKTELVSVTPSLAREWLNKNTKNRPIRPTHVETLRQSLMRGEHVTTHQGIAFDSDGELIDGQHRLTAISLMHEGFSWLMQVTWGLDRDTVFPVVDHVQAKRTTSDVLSVDRSAGETANFLARLYKGNMSGITPLYVAPFVAYVQPEVTELMSFCGRATKTWSSSPVRAAAVLSMKNRDSDYAKLVYRALVQSDFDAMPQSAKALFKAHMAGVVRAGAANDIFARCLKVFEPQNAKLGKIQINDVSVVIAQTRGMLERAVFGPAKKKASAVEREANGTVYQRNSSGRAQHAASTR